MNEALLHRRRKHDKRGWRPWLIGAGALLIASLLWHAARPALVRFFAANSLGCPSRNLLVDDALRQAGHEVLESERYGVAFGVMAFPAPGRGSVVWPIREVEQQEAIVGQLHRDTYLYGIADADLRGVGNLCVGQYSYVAVFGDRDGDALPEGKCFFSLFPGLSSANAYGHAIVRLGASENAIAGLVLIDASAFQVQSEFVRPIWRDVDDDGNDELVLHLMSWSQPAGKLPRIVTVETLATLEWTGPGGVLAPREPLDDDRILIWKPPNGKPHTFSHETAVDDVSMRLLPPPEGFGVMPTTQPARVPRP